MKFFKKLKMPQWLVLVLTFVVGFSVGLLAWWGVMQVMAIMKKPPADDHRVPPTQVEETTTTTTTTDEGVIQPTPQYDPAPPQKKLNIKWTTPKKVDPNIIFSKLYYDPSIPSPMPFPKGDIGGINSNFEFWDKGIVEPSVEEMGSLGYAGFKVYVMTYDAGGLGSSREMVYVLVSPDGQYAYTNGQFGEGNWLETYLREMDGYSVIAPEEPPMELTLANGKKIERKKFGGSIAADPSCTRQGCPSRSVVAQSTDGWKIYEPSPSEGNYFDPSGCLIVFGPSGIAYAFYSELPATVSVTDPYAIGADSAVSAASIRWETIYKEAKGSYIPYQLTGCGGHECAKIIPDTDLRDELVTAGHTQGGDEIYAAKDPAKLKDVRESYEHWIGYDSVTGEKSSFNDFIKNHPVPVFFWKDALGRWVQYTVMDVLPVGECGKPVIYLYPEKTTPVSVKLPSFINVTQSEPTYPSMGWNVVAHPDGQLEYADGQTYGSLYWEGTGVGYVTPKEGFLLKDGEVNSKLAELLAKYGLNETESREFREFWVPKMTGAQYYRVSFLTSEWSKAAPLFVSPRPTSVIRIFMDWQKLNAPISLPEPRIVTPERNGFTLVEWGGLLH